MASKQGKFCAKSQKNTQQTTQQRVNSNISLETTAKALPAVDDASMKRNNVPIGDKHVLQKDSVKNTEQQFKVSDIGHCTTNFAGTHMIKGRRIIDVPYFYEQVQVLNSHAPRNAGCNFSTMDCYKEIRRGLKSYFFFKCAVCGFRKQIASNRPGNGMQDINTAAVAASNKIGMGLNEAKQFFAQMGIPFENSTEHGTESAMQDVNTAAVAASNKIGIGFNESEQFFAQLGIPYLSSAEYDKQQKILKHKG